MRPSHLLALAASTVLAVSVFLPWMRVGDAGLAGVPDPSGLFVLVTGVAGLGIAAFGLVRGRDVRPWVMLAGLAALTTLVVVWRTGPATLADRAQARAEALAIVDGVAVQPPPAVRVGPGLVLGLVASATVFGAGLTAYGRASRR